MKFGIHNPSWLFGPDPHEIFEALKHKVQLAETQGFAWFSVMDHLIQIPGVGVADEPFMESWTTLAALAAVTSKIRLSPLVSSVAYRNPAHLAKMVATVDVISRGRITLGIGAGWHDVEYKQYGWEFPPRPAVRIGQMEEAMRLIKLIWTEKRATFHGKYFHIEEAILEPKPVQKPHPPILVGGGGEQLTLRALAREGDACNLFGDSKAVKHKLDVLRGHCETAGRNYDEIERTSTVGFLLARDDATLKTKRERLGPIDTARVYVATPAQAVDIAGGYRDVGLNLLITRIHGNDAETQELLASDVIPHFN